MEPENMVIDVDTSDAIEMGPVEAGEYKVQVLKAVYKEGTSTAGNDWKGIILTLDIPGEVSADIFSHMVFLPHEGQEGKQYERAKADFSKFKQAFGFGPADTFTVDDLVRREAWAYLTIDSDPEYGERNKVSKWISGPSSGGGANGAAGAGAY